MADPYLLGLDIGGTKCAAILGQSDGTILARSEWLSEAQRGPVLMLDDLVRQSQALLAQHGGGGDGGAGTNTLGAVGVSIGGPLDAARGIVLGPPNLPSWEHVPLRDLLVQKFHVPVGVEHDAAACALAEYRWGAGRKAGRGGIPAERLIYLTCGTGFGAGFVFDGKPYQGAAGLNVEIGHIRYQRDEPGEGVPEAFGKVGSQEAFCSAPGLGRIAAWRFPKRWGAPHPVPTPREIAALFEAGDLEALEVVSINARATGDVCAMFADMLRPDLIVLGSLARYLGDRWVELVRRRWRRESLATSAQVCRVVGAELAEKLQDLSALVVADAAWRSRGGV